MLWCKQSICPAKEGEGRLGREIGKGLLGEGRIFIKKKKTFYKGIAPLGDLGEECRKSKWYDWRSGEVILGFTSQDRVPQDTKKDNPSGNQTRFGKTETEVLHFLEVI